MIKRCGRAVANKEVWNRGRWNQSASCGCRGWLESVGRSHLAMARRNRLREIVVRMDNSRADWLDKAPRCGAIHFIGFSTGYGLWPHPWLLLKCAYSATMRGWDISSYPLRSTDPHSCPIRHELSRRYAPLHIR